MSSDLQHKLSRYEIPPPPGAWESIAASLDRQAGSFSHKLSQYKETPPASVWTAIAGRLDDEGKAPVVPFFKRYHRPLKYSGVAAAILLFGILSSLLLTKKTESETAGQPIVVAPPPRSASPSLVRPTAPEKTGPVVTIASREPKLVEKKAARPAGESRAFAYVQNNPPAAQRPVSDNYMLFIDGDGNALRLSKKLFNAFACAAYDYVCKQRISALQKKAASSASTTDFTGILDILRNLQENQ